MNLKTRRTFFYALTLVFILVGAYLLISAQGWVLDIKNFRVVRTGSLFLKYVPSDASVEIDGEISGASPGILSGGTLVSKLVPGEYDVKISQTGYLPWQKKLEVGEALVTSVSQIRLWPNKWLSKEVATSSPSDFWLTGAGAILQLKDKTLHLDGFTLRGGQVVLSDQNSSYLISSDGKNHFLTNLDNPKSPINLSALFKSLSQNSSSSAALETPVKFFLHPFSDGKIIVVTKNSLYSLDTKRTSLNKLLSVKNIIASAVSNNEVFVEDNKGNLASYNLFLQTAGSYEDKFPTDASIKASSGGTFAFFLRENGELLRYDRSSKALETLSKNVANFFVSPDERRIIILTNDDKLRVEVMLDYYADGDVKRGDDWTISSGNGTVRDFKWLPDAPNYGFVLSGEKLFITELDKRTPQNAYPVADGVKKFFVQGNNIYVLKTDGTLLEMNR